jgi:hypothetical protein
VASHVRSSGTDTGGLPCGADSKPSILTETAAIRLQRVLIACAAVVYGGWLLVASAVFVSAEVIARKVFLIAKGANEISAMSWRYVCRVQLCAYRWVILHRRGLQFVERKRALIDVFSAATLAAPVSYGSHSAPEFLP